MLFRCTGTHTHTHTHTQCVHTTVHIGNIRALACTENWIAAGSNNGTVNSLDLRNGEFQCAWRPSELPAVQVSGTIHHVTVT